MDEQSIDFNIWRDQQEAIAQGVLTNSKHPQSHILGVYPTHVKGGNGCKLYGTDGKKYVDYICGLGTNLVGYGNATVGAEVSKTLSKGFSHSLPTHYEIATAEIIKSMVPWVDRVKFLKTGSEACTAAVVVARAVTQRSMVLSEGYHGWHPEFTSLTPPGWGCPHSPHIRRLEKNYDLDGVAAVIVEPVITQENPDRREWLRDLRDACDKTGTLLIFDEVITGFRVPKYSISEYYKIRPDIIILGKGMASGLPLAAVCGKKEVMDDRYFVSSTYAGDIVSLAAARSTLALIRDNHEYDMTDLWESGLLFKEEFNRIWPQGIMIQGYGTRGRFVGEDRVKHLFFQEMCRAGFLFCASWFYNWPLMQHRKSTIDVATDCLHLIKQGKVKLEGKAPVSPFAVRIRNEQERASEKPRVSC